MYQFHGIIQIVAFRCFQLLYFISARLQANNGDDTAFICGILPNELIIYCCYFNGSICKRCFCFTVKFLDHKAILRLVKEFHGIYSALFDINGFCGIIQDISVLRLDLLDNKTTYQLRDVNGTCFICTIFAIGLTYNSTFDICHFKRNIT